MFDIGWSELVVIGIVALIVIGPKELPGVLRMMGQWMGKIRRMASEFQGQFQEAMREAEMADLKKQVDQLSSSARDFTANFDPLSDVKNEVSQAGKMLSDPVPTSPATDAVKPDGATASTPASTEAEIETKTTDASVPTNDPAPPAEHQQPQADAQVAGGGRPA